MGAQLMRLSPHIQFALLLHDLAFEPPCNGVDTHSIAGPRPHRSPPAYDHHPILLSDHL